MINLLLDRWEYFRNSEGSYSIFPTGSLNSPVIAKVVTEGVADPEAVAKCIAAVPELFSAVKQGIEIMRATRSYLSSHGLTIEGINEVIGTHDELIYRLEE
ncbi:MAG: hypothetical protein IJT58_00525 [Synergistaceae bacterium]|nr:hypothetical protein [Synergistaceae bacterium]